MRKVKVYISSPYTNGDKEANVQLQMDAYYHLAILGFNPHMPVYNHFIQLQHANMDVDWLEMDIDWLSDCDIAIRIHPHDKFGNEIQSPGADEEEKYCNAKGIPMFHFDTIEEMVRMMSTFERMIA